MLGQEILIRKYQTNPDTPTHTYGEEDMGWMGRRSEVRRGGAKERDDPPQGTSYRWVGHLLVLLDPPPRKGIQNAPSQLWAKEGLGGVTQRVTASPSLWKPSQMQEGKRKRKREVSMHRRKGGLYAQEGKTTTTTTPG